MAFAGIEVAIGKAIAPFQGLMNQFAQIGLAIGGVGQLASALGGLARALGIVNIATSVWAARSVMTTAVTNVLSAAFNGASVGATTLKWALRGLLSATVVGAAITAWGMDIEWLIEKLTGSSEATDKLGQKMKETSNAFEDQRKQALAPTLTKYQELQTKWKSLKSVHEKNQFIKTNKDAFQQLGVSIDSVGQAESLIAVSWQCGRYDIQHGATETALRPCQRRLSATTASDEGGAAAGREPWEYGAGGDDQRAGASSTATAWSSWGATQGRWGRR